MSKTTMTAAFAVMLAASMPIAYAQTMPSSPPANGAAGAAGPASNEPTGANPPSESGGSAAAPARENGASGANAGGAATGTTTGAAGSAESTTGAAGSNAAGQKAEVHLGEGQMLFSKMSGAAVYDEQNKQIGDISNLVLDPNGQVAAVLIKRGGFLGLGGKLFAVPMNEVKMTSADNGNPRFQVSMTEEQVKTAPTYDVNPQSTSTGSSNAPAGQGTGNAGAGNGSSGSNR